MDASLWTGCTSEFRVYKTTGKQERLRAHEEGKDLGPLPKHSLPDPKPRKPPHLRRSALEKAETDSKHNKDKKDKKAKDKKQRANKQQPKGNS